METNKIYQGEALKLAKQLPDNYLNMIMTSPPYWGLRDYGTAVWIDGDENCDHEPDQEWIDHNFHNKTAKQFEIGALTKKESAKTRWYNQDGSCPKCGAVRIDDQLGLEKTIGEYINKLCNIFDELKRALRGDGTCWINIGDTYMNNSSYSPEGRQGYNNDKTGMIYKSGLPEKSLFSVTDI